MQFHFFFILSIITQIMTAPLPVASPTPTPRINIKGAFKKFGQNVKSAFKGKIKSGLTKAGAKIKTALNSKKGSEGRSIGLGIGSLLLPEVFVPLSVANKGLAAGGVLT